MRRRTGRAERLFRKHAATSTPYNGVQRNTQRARQRARARSAFLQQVEGHALGRFRPDARQGTQCVDELSEAWGMFHASHTAGADAQNGSFSPGGNCIPAVTAAIFSAICASTL